jgi:transcription-repair coupling factor (superfamily II helicase)
VNLVHIRRAVDSAVRQHQSALAAEPVLAGARPVVLASLAHAHAGPVLNLTGRPDQAEQLCPRIAAYLPPEQEPRLWETTHATPYEQLPYEHQAAAERVRVLTSLAAGETPVIVASARNLMHLTVAPDDLRTMGRSLRVGDRINSDDLLRWAALMGYQRAPLVFEPGTIAQRGGVIDLFPPDFDQPVRLDLFGDEIDSIRLFDAESQRSRAPLSELSLLPPVDIPAFRADEAARRLRQISDRTLRAEVRAEWHALIDRVELGQLPAGMDLVTAYFGATSSLLDYLPAGTLVLFDDQRAVMSIMREIAGHAEELREAFVANGELPDGLLRPYAEPDALETRLATFECRNLSAVPDEAESDDSRLFRVAPLFAGRTQRVVAEVSSLLDEGWAVQVVTDQPRRLSEIFEDEDVFPRKIRANTGDAALPPGTLDIRVADASIGWSLPAQRLLILTDFEIFGFSKQTSRRRRGRSVAENVAFAESLTPGEYVVHVDQGVARFVGLTRNEAAGVEREYLLLEYAKGDKLYVPVDQSDRVSRYSSGGLEPRLTRLGTGEWQRAKSRVRRAVREMAFELIQLYAARESGEGIQYPPNTTWDEELAESFAFIETADQQSAIIDVTGDLETDRPMDRLVCGDVGFGKTEVALRAAFKVINAGKQVAVLVPTTVLALQHYATFRQRLAAFPARVEMLSRLKSRSEQGEIVEGLAEGSVDIVIGTHRLVQNDIRFQDLGLVVIDEEQRFGVRHKEFLKRLRTQVDVLTMSATPIPRTLHMSLAGIRDISIINTAPQERLPIRTFVTDYSESLVREVILREIDRGGQVYFVHNRVHSIDHLAARLRELVPEARFGIGHGQMEEDVLEDVILGFVRHEFDVLICTTIIESGVDIANVNTIVIDDADRFGLTQLYQLRGRVGRGSHRAYAYLLHKPHKALSEVAQARLDAIQEATELGAGMQVALRDMEIRGAGNVLGAEQSGNIADVGYDLYIRLLSQAVEEIRQGRPFAEPTPLTLDLPLMALIPASYISDVELRLNTYRRIASAKTLADVDDVEAELRDRFGEPPEEVEHLIALIRVRIRCAALGMQSVVEREREIVLRPVETTRLKGLGLERVIGKALRTTPNSVRIRMPDLEIPWEQALEAVIGAVEMTQRS